MCMDLGVGIGVGTCMCVCLGSQMGHKRHLYLPLKLLEWCTVLLHVLTHTLAHTHTHTCTHTNTHTHSHTHGHHSVAPGRTHRHPQGAPCHEELAHHRLACAQEAQARQLGYHLPGGLHTQSPSHHSGMKSV